LAFEIVVRYLDEEGRIGDRVEIEGRTLECCALRPQGSRLTTSSAVLVERSRRHHPPGLGIEQETDQDLQRGR
jgi:hypothetical protein